MPLRLLLAAALAFVAACAPRALPLPADHPARPTAPAVRPHDRSPTLAPGVAGDVLP